MLLVSIKHDDDYQVDNGLLFVLHIKCCVMDVSDCFA